MILGVNPKVDYAFKWLFGNERNTGPLIHILHAILNPTPEEQIVEVEILNPFTQKVEPDEKLSVLDVKARDQLGRHFNVEMQMVPPLSFLQRILYYWGKLYTGQLRKGDEYDLLRPTISVAFMDAVLYPTVPEHHLEFRLIDTTAGVVLTNDLAIHLFELPKFSLGTTDLATPADAWLYFLRHAEGLDTEALPGPLNTPEIREAAETLAMLTEIDTQRIQYEERLKALHDRQTWLKAADHAHARGFSQGRAEGRAEGRTEGRAEGEARGDLFGRIGLAQRALRREVTPRAALDAMSSEALESFAMELERELLG